MARVCRLGFGLAGYFSTEHRMRVHAVQHAPRKALLQWPASSVQVSQSPAFWGGA
jgi:hypothetical protein